MAKERESIFTDNIVPWNLTYARGGAPRWLAEARHRLGPPENSALKQ